MSLIDTISRSLPRVHREGYKFVGIFAAASVILGFLWSPLFWIGLGLTIWCACFFRDPDRATPLNDDFVISPADGRVSYIGKAVPPAELGMGDAPVQRISVFMNVFNCHINRAPVKGKIKKLQHTRGKFMNAELDKASEENERNALTIESTHGDIGVVQIAGLVARRIVCWAERDEDLIAGERFGLIRFGSRLDVYLPEGAHPVVALGQTAIAGETILARFDETVAFHSRIG